MSIKCCNGCVAPKRHTACWGHCPDYLKEKEEYDQQMEVERRRQAISNGLTAQRTASVTKALRGRRNKDGK